MTNTKLVENAEIENRNQDQEKLIHFVTIFHNTNQPQHNQLNHNHHNLSLFSAYQTQQLQQQLQQSIQHQQQKQL